MSYVYSDFDTLAVGWLSAGGSPTLAELDAATTGGSWDFYGAPQGFGVIRADGSGLGDQALEIKHDTTAPLFFNNYGARLDFDSGQLVSDLGSDYIEIQFKSGLKRSTGFTRKGYWFIKDGTTTLVELRLQDGKLYFNNTNLGNIASHEDAYTACPWESNHATVGTSPPYDVVYNFSIKIYGDGSVDVSVIGIHDASNVSGSKGAGEVSTGATINRLEYNYYVTTPASPPCTDTQGIYLGYVQVGTPPIPSTSRLDIPSRVNTLQTSNALWP